MYTSQGHFAGPTRYSTLSKVDHNPQGQAAQSNFRPGCKMFAMGTSNCLDFTCLMVTILRFRRGSARMAVQRAGEFVEAHLQPEWDGSPVCFVFGVTHQKFDTKVLGCPGVYLKLA